MSEYSSNPEILDNILSISSSTKRHKQKIINIIQKVRSVAFLGTENFEIHIGSDGMHSNLYSRDALSNEQAEILTKGQLSGSAKKVSFDFSEKQKDSETSTAQIRSLQASVRNKINSFLIEDLGFYFQ